MNIVQLRYQGFTRDIHAHHPDEHSGFINGHEIGAYPFVTVYVRANPGRTAKDCCRLIPGCIKSLRGVKPRCIQRFLFNESGFSDFRVVEAVFIPADFRINAIVIRVHSLGIVCNAGKEFTDLIAVIGEVRVKGSRLLRRLLFLFFTRPDHAAFHKEHAVQVFDRYIGCDFHGLPDAIEILFQGFLRILIDQVHHAHGILVGLIDDNDIACRKDGQNTCKNQYDGDSRDRCTYRMHVAPSLRIIIRYLFTNPGTQDAESLCNPVTDISRYMFLTEPFQEAQIPSSLSEVT